MRDAGREAGVAGLPRLRVILICLALLLEGMSSSSINVQVHALRGDLGISGPDLQLVAGTFLIAYAGLLPAAGRLVDVWDRRSVFLLGVSLFGVGCLLCASATSPWLLIAGRCAQGAGAALSAPAALALITADLPEGAPRNRAIGIYGAMGAAGFSLGLVLPGFVVAQWGWRISFVIFLPVVLLVLLATWSIRSVRPVDHQRVDWIGSLLLTGLLMVVMYGVGGVGAHPPLLLGVLGAVALVLMIILGRRGGLAGFPRDVLGSPRVCAACLALAAVYAGVLSSMYILSLGLQIRHGLTAFELGLLILPQPVFFTLLAGPGARLVSRWGSWRVLALGLGVIMLSLVHLGLAGLSTPVFVGVLPAMAGVGAGLALCFPAASIMAVDAAPDEARGTAASLLTASQNIGGSAGLAVLTALSLVPGPDNAVGVQHGSLLAAGVVLIGGLAALAVARVQALPLVAAP